MAIFIDNHIWANNMKMETNICDKKKCFEASRKRELSDYLWDLLIYCLVDCWRIEIVQIIILFRDVNMSIKAIVTTKDPVERKSRMQGRLCLKVLHEKL